MPARRVLPAVHENEREIVLVRGARVVVRAPAASVALERRHELAQVHARGELERVRDFLPRHRVEVEHEPLQGDVQVRRERVQPRRARRVALPFAPLARKLRAIPYERTSGWS